MQAAQFPVINLVDYQWLAATITSQQKQSEAAHKIDTSSGISSDSQMAASPTPVAKPTLPTKVANPPTARKGKRPHSKTLAVPIYEDPPTDEGEEIGKQPSQKRRKDGQKAKSSSLRVPVDENCPLAGRALFPSMSDAAELKCDRYTPSLY